MNLSQMLKDPKQRKKLLIGGGIGAALLLVLMLMRKKTAATTTAPAATAAGIDPTTGLPYASETGAGIDPSTGIPYAQELAGAGAGVGGGGSSQPVGVAPNTEFQDFGTLLGELFPGGLPGAPPAGGGAAPPVPITAPTYMGGMAPVGNQALGNPTNTGTAGTGSGTTRTPSQTPAPPVFNASTTPVAQQIAMVRAGTLNASQLGPAARKIYNAGGTSTTNPTRTKVQSSAPLYG